eukprot:scaffold54161_cov58-Phaeocystis_antarctica.AAC.2
MLSSRRRPACTSSAGKGAPDGRASRGDGRMDRRTRENMRPVLVSCARVVCSCRVLVSCPWSCARRSGQKPARRVGGVPDYTQRSAIDASTRANHDERSDGRRQRRPWVHVRGARPDRGEDEAGGGGRGAPARGRRRVVRPRRRRAGAGRGAQGGGGGQEARRRDRQRQGGGALPLGRGARAVRPCHGRGRGRRARAADRATVRGGRAAAARGADGGGGRRRERGQPMPRVLRNAQRRRLAPALLRLPLRSMVKSARLGSAPARLLCLLRARLAVQAGSALPGESPAHWAPSHCLGCSSEPPPKPPIPPPLTTQASPATAAYATEGSNHRLADPKSSRTLD